MHLMFCLFSLLYIAIYAYIQPIHIVSTACVYLRDPLFALDLFKILTIYLSIGTKLEQQSTFYRHILWGILFTFCQYKYIIVSNKWTDVFLFKYCERCQEKKYSCLRLNHKNKIKIFSLRFSNEVLGKLIFQESVSRKNTKRV